MAKYTPNSAREHPPKQKPGMGGTQCPGPPTNHGGGYGAGGNPGNSVIRTRPK
jgi:hypothetical protein